MDRTSRLWVLGAAAIALLLLLRPLPGAFALSIVIVAAITSAVAWRKPMSFWLRLMLALVVLALVFMSMGNGVGRDTGCALLAAMLAIKPSETSTLRDGRSLIGFALFAPFATFLLDQGPVTSLLGVLAILACLLSLQRLADAESRVPPSPFRHRLGTVFRLLLIGLPLTLTTFWLFPRLGAPLWGMPSNSMARPGLSDSMELGEMLDLLSDDAPAMRVRFFSEMPPPAQRYWRGPVLTHFDGMRWTRSSISPALPMPEVALQNALWDYEIEYEPTDRRYLAALELPLQAPEDTRLNSEYVLTASQPLSSLRRYRLQSSPPARLGTTMPGALLRSTLQLPPGHNPRTLELARQWRREAGRNDAAIVDRAMAWFHAEFGYTLDNAPLPSGDSADEFLFTHKQGYCEHFSSAFVVLMRGAGIPSRVVTGYVGGYINPLGGYLIVRNMDAHAWAEVWLEGRGWVRVDPTAAVAPERIYDTLDDRLVAGNNTSAIWQWSDFGDWMRRNWNDLVLGFDATRQQNLLHPFGLPDLQTRHLALLFVLGLLVVLGWMFWLLSRRERERDPLLRAWHRLDKRYARLGLGREPYEPAGEWTARVIAERPSVAGSLQPLSRRFVASRYAGEVSGSAGLIQDLRHHRP